jgi:hypothetical protein
MVSEHDLTGMPAEQFKELFNEAKRRCPDRGLKDIFLKLDRVL